MNRAQRRRAQRDGVALADLPAHTQSLSKWRPKGGVHYSVIHGTMTDNAFNWSLRALEGHDRANHQHIVTYSHMDSGPLLSHARNQMVQAFLAGDCEWWFTMDDDMIFHPDALDQLMALADADERPIVSGLYFGGGRSALITPHIFVIAQDSEGNYFTEKRTGFPWDMPFDCDAVGAGFMLVHRSVLERMGEVYVPKTAYPWFQETEVSFVDDGGTRHHMGIGEDVTFCIRARTLGYRIWVDPRIYLGHSKRYTIDRTVYEAQQKALVELGEDEVGRAHLRQLGVA
ncbi:MAG: glycosyltransferase family 2 protein [Chloroflexi bacterium]|nr:glycosyltransferase family 2 protein [Chloroflexota bacterium]